MKKLIAAVLLTLTLGAALGTVVVTHSLAQSAGAPKCTGSGC
jgi:hypothetical protein